jgi:hypothetical protein
MAERIGQLREPFDPTCNFIVVKPLRYAGVVYGPGQPFDKRITDPRRLRQLYDGRYLRQVVAAPVERRPRPVIELGLVVTPSVPRVKVNL